ncbi:hypothetical protein FACS189473_3600 [Spirochaetia bacterium]|nr:hypothetical protein FACS189473_3600 [Spirochaetia bacterium]
MPVENKLKAFTTEEIKDAYKDQMAPDLGRTGWTFYHEREFMENLLQTRFNFLIAVYALFVNAFFTTKDKDSKLIIVVLGLLIVPLMAITVRRIYIKVDILLQILYNLDKNQVFPIVKKELDRRELDAIHNKFPNANLLIGKIIPAILIASFIGGLIYLFKSEICIWIINILKNYIQL